MAEKALSFSISPCLFIGLGTNGWQMIDDLRRLCFEEFGVGGLPCFRYLALETNNERQEDNSFLPHPPQPFERVRPIYITVPDISVVRRRVDPALRSEFVPGLAEWLDRGLIERGSRSYTAGAGHLRQAGRLCLWENWAMHSHVGRELQQAVGQIRGQGVAEAAERFLRKDYFGNKKPNLVLSSESLIGNSPKVYVLGTLCGGTCSGTFIDIAYYVSDLLGVRNRSSMRKSKHPEVIGLFTVTDNLSIRGLDSQAHVANCWAALRELDYYYQPQSTYRAEFPGGRVVDTREEPFDSVYLESMANGGGKGGFESGDYHSLTQMCAMSLFTEVVAGMSAKKDEIRINFRAGDAGYLERNGLGNVRALSSFGLSAVWYPRYRITTAIVRRLGMEMCDGWLSSSNLNATVVQNDGEPEWKAIIEHARGSLVGSVSGAHCPINLEQKIEQLFTQYGETFMALDKLALAGAAGAFPPGEKPFSDKLKNPDGEYFLPVKNAEKLVGSEACRAVGGFLDRYLRTHSIAEARTLLEHFAKRATELEQSIPSELPVLTQTLDTSIAAEVFADKSSALLLMKSSAVWEYKAALLAQLKARVRGQLVAVREQMLKHVLGDLRREIANLTGLLAAMESRVQLLRDQCEREANEQIGFKQPSNIVPISKYGDTSIAQDVDFGTRAVLKNSDRHDLRRLLLENAKDTPIERFANNQVKDLLSQLDLVFGPKAQAIADDFNIGQQALTHLRNRVQFLIQTSQPYVEMIPGFTPMVTTQSPNFIFCSNVESGSELSELAQNEFIGSPFMPAVSPLDHFIFFYQELPGIAISDLLFSGAAAKILQEREAKSDRIATSFSHRIGEKMFDVTASLDYEKLRRWVGLVKGLAPDVFQSVGGEPALEYFDENGLADPLLINRDDSLRVFVEKRRTLRVLERLMEMLQKLGKTELLQRMNEQLARCANAEEHGKMRTVHAEILSGVFSA